nr:hypothetical protein [Tanacetum cinerariifolium]
MKLLKDLQIIKNELIECNHPTFFDDNEDHLENSSNEIAASNSNQEKEGPPQDFDIRQLIREESCIEVCEEQKQNMEDTILELVKICRQKELFCMHDNVDDFIESDLNFKLLSINSQCLNKEKQEVKNIMEQPAKRGTRIIQSLQNFRVIHKSSISLKNTSQISPVHAVAPILPTKEPEYSPSMSENEVTLEDKRECDMPVCKNSPIYDDDSEIFSDSSNDDDILSNEDAFEDIEYIEASLPDLEIVSVEEENDVHQEEEEVDLEDISQIKDVVLCEKLLSINRLIANIKSLNDNPTPDCVLNSFVSFPISEESDNSLLDNSSPEFKIFAIIRKRREVERLINVVKNDIFDDSTNDPLFEEADLFLASDNSIPPGIENFSDDSEGDIRFLEALLIDDSVPFPDSEASDFDNPSFPRPPPEPPEFDFKLDTGEEISVVMNDSDELKCLDPRDEFDDDDYSSFMFVKVFSFLLSAESEDTIFDPSISV